MILPPFVLVQETIIKFGFDPTIFTYKDYSKQVVRTCFVCHNIYNQQLGNSIRAFKENKKCKFCANKERALANAEKHSNWMKENLASGNYIHPMLGHNHSDESKDKMRIAKEGITLEEKVGKERADELKKQASERFSGQNNPFYGKTHSKEVMDKILPVLLKNVRRGKDSNFYGKKYWPNRNLFEYNGLKLRSNWEVNTCKFFDEHEIKYQFEPKYFELSNGTTYTPDFYLPDLNLWIEIKGFWYDDARIKFDMFLKEYPLVKIDVWDKEQLSALGII